MNITIPENATNGDMILSLFPNSDIVQKPNGDYMIRSSLTGYALFFDHDWWNAPYQINTN